MFLRLSCVFEAVVCFYVLYVFVVSAPFFGLHHFFPLSFSLHVVCYTRGCSCTSSSS